MEVNEAITRLRAYQRRACEECIHPDSGTYCLNKCRLPEAYEEAIIALKKRKEQHEEVF